MKHPFTDNIHIFRQRFPDYPLEIPEGLPSGVVRLETPSGDWSVAIDGRSMHSRRAPRREAERLAERIAVDSDTWLVLFGFGIGYLAEAVARRYPHNKLIILDPDPRGFKAALQLQDMSWLLSHPEITLLIGPNAPRIDAALSDLNYHQLQIVSHTPSIEMQRQFFADAQQRIERLLQRRRVNHNTLKRFGKLWVRNYAANLQQNLQAVSIDSAADSFRGIPGVLIAAGPTFDEIVPHLQELRERCLLVAVDTALPLCLRHGIDPDFVVVVDPQYWNTRHLDRCGSSQAIAVSESSAHPRVFRQLRGPFLLGESLFPLGRLLDAPLDIHGALGAGGSVATSAYEVMKLLGCRQIFTAGLDLGFPDDQTHSSGSFFEERLHTIGTRLQPAAMLQWRYLVDGGKLQGRDYRGRPIATDARMQVYQQWFAMQLESSPEIRLQPLSETGLAIPGAHPAAMKAVLQHPARRREIDAVLGEIRSRSGDPQGRARRLRPHLAELQKGLQEIQEIAARAHRHIDAAWDSPAAWTSDWQARLDACDQAIRQHPAKDIVGFLLQEALDSIQAADKSDHPLQSSRTLYVALQESASFHADILGRMLQGL